MKEAIEKAIERLKKADLCRHEREYIASNSTDLNTLIKFVMAQ
jgi:hypothetical protein